MNSTGVLVTVGTITTVSVLALLVYAVTREPNQIITNNTTKAPPPTQQAAYVIGGSPQVAQAGGNIAIAQQFVDRIGPATARALSTLDRPLRTMSQRSLAFVSGNTDQYVPLF